MLLYVRPRSNFNRMAYKLSVGSDVLYILFKYSFLVCVFSAVINLSVSLMSVTLSQKQFNNKHNNYYTS